MLKLLGNPTLLLLYALPFSVLGQGFERTLENISRSLVTSVTTAHDIPDTTYITLEEYHRLIDRQPLSSADRSSFKMEVNGFYPGQKEEFLRGLEQLQLIYVNEIGKGASIEMDTILFREMEDTYNIFEVRIKLIFSYPDEEDSEIYLETMAASMRRRWSFISPVVESYE